MSSFLLHAWCWKLVSNIQTRWIDHTTRKKFLLLGSCNSQIFIVTDSPIVLLIMLKHREDCMSVWGVISADSSVYQFSAWNKVYPWCGVGWNFHVCWLNFFGTNPLLKLPAGTVYSGKLIKQQFVLMCGEKSLWNSSVNRYRKLLTDVWFAQVIPILYSWCGAWLNFHWHWSPPDSIFQSGKIVRLPAV